MLTAREYADLHGYKYATVYSWCKKGVMQGTIKQPSKMNGSGFVYMIPAESPPPPLRSGAGRPRTQNGVSVKMPPPPKEQPTKAADPPKRSKREINIFIRKHCKTMTYGQMSKALGIPTLKLRQMYDHLHERDGI